MTKINPLTKGGRKLEVIYLGIHVECLEVVVIRQLLTRLDVLKCKEPHTINTVHIPKQKVTDYRK